MNATIWGIFLNTTLQAVVHVGQRYEVHLRFVKNHLWKSLEQLFNETRRLIRDQTEIIRMKTIELQRTYVEIDKLIVQQSKLDHQCRKLRLLRFSGLCWERCEMIRVQLGKTKSKCHSENNHFKELSRSGKNIPRIHDAGHLPKDSKF